MQWSSDIGEHHLNKKISGLHPSEVESLGAGQGLSMRMFRVFQCDCDADRQVTTL